MFYYSESTGFLWGIPRLKPHRYIETP